MNLLATAAHDAPVLAVIDDAHWLDAPSREALLFAARRIAGEGVVLLFATRDTSGFAGRDRVRWTARAAPGRHGGVVRGHGRRGRGGMCGRQLVAGYARQPTRAAGGDASNLIFGAADGTAPLAAPLAVGAALEQAFALDLDGLPGDTRRALLMAAASRTGVTGEILNALAATGLDRSALEPAEQLGLVTVAERVDFRHPLIRSAAYHGQDLVGSGRRTARSRPRSVPASDPRGTWPKPASGLTSRPRGRTGVLRSTALARSAYAAAGSAFETAAGLSPDDADRLRRTLVAGRALWLGGESQRAADLLHACARARDRAGGPGRPAAAPSARRCSPARVGDQAMLVAEAERVLPHDHARAAAMFATASLACILLGDIERAGECARRADAVAERDSAGRDLRAPAMLAIVAASLGESAGPQSALRLARAVQAVQLVGEFFTIVSALAWTFSWIEEWTAAQDVIERVIGAARAAGAPSVLPVPLGMLAELEFRRGRLAAAYAAATESVQLAADTGQTIASAHSLVMLARTEAVLGHEEQCRAHVAATLTLTARTGARAFDSYWGADPRAARALPRTPGARRRQRAGSARLDEPSSLVLTSAIQASAEVSRRTSAAAQSRRPPARLRSSNSTPSASVCAGPAPRPPVAAGCWPRSSSRRSSPRRSSCSATTCRSTAPARNCRSGCAAAARARRAGARTVLRPALDYFEAAGAEPWAEQARAELRASGETPLRHANGSLRSLTPQELQVALIVAKGATNREAAASLFLSEKTVEFHLSNAYRKLGLRSRGELIRRVEGLP